MGNLEYILQKQEQRLDVLKFIWEKTRDDTDYCSVESEQISEAVDLSLDDVSIILNYLREEELIKAISLSSPTTVFYSKVEELHFFDIKISHKGRCEIENAITKPNEDTKHFLSQVIIFIMNKTNNVIAGSDAIGNVFGSNVGGDVNTNVRSNPDLLKEIEELRSKIYDLPIDRQEIALEAINNIEEASKVSNYSEIKKNVFTLWGIGSGMVNFANSVTPLAQRFGVNFS